MSGETDKQIVQALALRSAAAGASGALASSHGTDWPARVSVRELEESGRYRVTVHGPGDPPPGDLGAAVLHAEGCAARVLAAPSGSSLQRAELGLLESALGGVLRECVVAGERLRLVLERYVREGLNVEESTGERPPELTSAELLSSLLGRWAEVRVAGDRDPVKNPRPGDVWRLADESMWRVDQVLGESTTGVIVGASLILVRVGVVDTRRARVDLLALPDLLFGAMLLRAGAAKEA